jgi:hypothetical protein
MDTTVERVEIQVEDIGQTSWWSGILTTLMSQYGTAQLRFAARPAGRPPYTSGTFPAPRTWGVVDPAEAWGPGMQASLQEICQELGRDGWVRTGTGDHAWSFVYERVDPAGVSRGPEPTVVDRRQGEAAERSP